MDFLEKLTDQMNQKGLNKHTLSKASGVPYTTIDSLYKKGYGNIKLTTLQRLSATLEVSIDYLAGDNEHKPAIEDKALSVARAYRAAPPSVRRIVDVALFGE